MRFAGVVRKRQERMSKRGKRFAYLSLSDSAGDFEVFVGEDLLTSSRSILEAGSILDALQKCLETLKTAPAKSMGYIEIIAPLGEHREGHWRLPGKIGVDGAVQAAIKATKLVETIEEIAA